MTPGHIKKHVTKAMDFATDKLKDSLSFLKDIKESSIEKIGSLVNDILGLAPLIEVSGFDMKDINIDVGIPPGINIAFVKTKDVDAETINKLLEENKDKEVLKLIVRALQKADSMQKEMNLSHYKFQGLGMKIGLPTDLSLKFSRV